jgi:hypothetical protein
MVQKDGMRSPEFPPLADALDHPLYEMEMLVATRCEISRTDNPTVRNALLESFVIHARALAEFFGDKKNTKQSPERHNWSAKDFVPGWTKSNMDGELINRMNREVCHIGKSRQRPEKRRSSWDFEQVIQMLAPSVLRFIGGITNLPNLMCAHNNAERAARIAQVYDWSRAMPKLKGALASCTMRARAWRRILLKR